MDVNKKKECLLRDRIFTYSQNVTPQKTFTKNENIITLQWRNLIDYTLIK